MPSCSARSHRASTAQAGSTIRPLARFAAADQVGEVLHLADGDLGEIEIGLLRHGASVAGDGGPQRRPPQVAAIAMRRTRRPESDGCAIESGMTGGFQQWGRRIRAFGGRWRERRALARPAIPVVPDEGPIFIVGLYKCGTSWLLSCLHAHPQVRALREFDLVRAIQGGEGRLRLASREERMARFFGSSAWCRVPDDVARAAAAGRARRGGRPDPRRGHARPRRAPARVRRSRRSRARTRWSRR